MEKLAKKLANNISISLGYDNEKEKVIAYGLTGIIQIIVTFSLVIILGLIVGTAIEAFIICFSISALRKYSGGAHVSSIELCTSVGVIYSVGFSLIIKYLLAPLSQVYPMLFVLIVVYAFSYYAIHKLAPVDSPNKPIKTEKKKRRMKKGSYIVLSVYFAISILLLLLGQHVQNGNSLGISLLAGIVWQVLTLTKFGLFVLNGISIFVIKIFGHRKEVRRL